MSRKINRGTRKHTLLWVNLFMLLLFVSFVILKWWVMALGLLIISMITLNKELGEPKEEKQTHSTGKTGNYSNSVFNRRVGESLIEFPVNIEGTNIVAVTYKDETI